MSKNTATIIAPALANGAFGKASVHCRRSLDQQHGKTAPADKIGAKATKAKAEKPAKPVKTPKPAPTAIERAGKLGIINSAGRVVLKANKEVRAALKAAAQLAGGSRLQPQGMSDFSAFLNGFAFKADATGVMPLAFDVVGQDGKVVTMAISPNGDWKVA